MTTYREFEHNCDEWCFSNGVILTADLTLVLSADPHRDIIAGIRLEAVRYTKGPVGAFLRTWQWRSVDTWLSDAMTAWVASNQLQLEAVKRQYFAEAAE